MKRKIELIVILFFLLLPLFFFREYIFRGNVPFSANLLVSYYSPWKEEVFPGYEGGVPNKPIGFDNVRLFYPNLKLTLGELRAGRMPLWNPYIFSGNPHLAMFQTAVFYPLNIVYFLLPTIDAWSLLVVIQPILAAGFMYLFLRSLRLSLIAGVFGAIAYAYSGWMIAWWEESLVVEHSILWLPLGLYASSALWESKKMQLWTVVLFGLSIILSILAGFFQMTMYLMLTLVVWNIFCYFQHKKESETPTKTRALALSLVVAIAVSAIQWLPAWEAYRFSPRLGADVKFLYESYLVPLHHLLTLVAPDYWGNPGGYNYFFPKAFYHEKVLYIGIFPLLFFLFALVSRTDTKGKFWKLFSLVAISLGLQLPTSWVWYVLKVPILSSSQPSRIFSIATLGMAVVAAYGIDIFRKTNSKKFLFWVLGSITLLLSAGWAYVGYVWAHMRWQGPLWLWCKDATGLVNSACLALYHDDIAKWGFHYTTTSFRNLVLPTLTIFLAWFTILFLWKFKRVVIAIAFVVTLGGSAYFAQKFLYFSDRRLVFPTVPVIAKLQELAGTSRVWGYGNAYVENNLLSYYGLYSAEGYSPFFSMLYGQLLHTIRSNGTLTSKVNRADVDLSPIFEDESIIDNPYRMRLFSLLDIRYIIEAKQGPRKELLSTEKRFPSAYFSLVWEDGKWRIWEFTRTLPRVWFTPQYQVVADGQKTVDMLFEPKFGYQQTILVNQNPFGDSLQEQQKSVGNVVVRTYSPSEIILDVNAVQRGLVFLSDTFYPGWKATIDGKEVPILRADYAFRAVPVEKGTHLLRMTYKPRAFIVGAWMTGVVITALFILVVLQVIRTGSRR